MCLTPVGGSGTFFGSLHLISLILSRYEVYRDVCPIQLSSQTYFVSGIANEHISIRSSEVKNMSWGNCCNSGSGYGSGYPVAGYGGGYPSGGMGSNFALLVVLFILLIIILAAKDKDKDC